MIAECPCGARFRSAATEVKHRHNFPAMCRKPKQKRQQPNYNKILDAKGAPVEPMRPRLDIVTGDGSLHKEY